MKKSENETHESKTMPGSRQRGLPTHLSININHSRRMSSHGSEFDSSSAQYLEPNSPEVPIIVIRPDASDNTRELQNNDQVPSDRIIRPSPSFVNEPPTL